MANKKEEEVTEEREPSSSSRREEKKAEKEEAEQVQSKNPTISEERVKEAHEYVKSTTEPRQ